MTYSEDQKANALAALAANGGNLSATAKALGIPQTTLRHWRDGAGVNQEVAKIGEQKRKALADQLEDLAYTLAEAIPGKVAEAKLSEIATSMGIAIDKMRLLREQPTERMEHQLSAEDRALRVAELMTTLIERKQARILEVE